ncbi:hypothetical protein OG552_10320 [Streptomyces sp. NBC_01476]|uniref:hypothetical protein n=1 Tax=Streptomyces sp. NBC_01476 TaxID=2903881 RepID=UPI002E326EE7|nr:hypothetical protein [Streptomyces sp. NBC_01476]
MPEAPLPSVEPGQVWADNDKRGYGRKIQVISIEDGYALTKAVSLRGGSVSPTTKPPTRIRLDRFKPTSTGYRLVRHADGSAA